MIDAFIFRGPSTDQGTLGSFKLDHLSFFSLELPWRDNQTGLSCIPEPGDHLVQYTWSPSRKKFLYLVTGTKGRYGIRMHSANYAGDVTKGFRSHLEGCIALGKKYGVMDKQMALLLSRPAMTEFEFYMKGKPFMLHIKEVA